MTDAGTAAPLIPDAGADAATRAHDTARALASLEPTVAAESGERGPIAPYGKAELWEHGKAVTLRLEVHACKPGTYQARLHAGADCAAAEGGDGIAEVNCNADGALIAYYARLPDQDKPWTIGGSPDTDVVGHAFSLSDAATGQMVTCGVVERAPDAPPSETTDTQGPTLQVRGAIAGVCVFDRLVAPHPEGCPDYLKATTCASTYCELNRCIDRCATYVKCLAQARGLDICMAAYSCEPSNECSQCQSEVVRCSVSLCIETLTCAAPARPNGPCSKLQQCCDGDADRTGCLDITQKLARFGDAECQRVIDSWSSSGQHKGACPVD